MKTKLELISIIALIGAGLSIFAWGLATLLFLFLFL